MDTAKKTGLGSSLLWRRTERPAALPAASSDISTPDIPSLPVVSAAPQPEEVRVVPQPPAPEVVQSPQPDSHTSQTKPQVLRDRCTLYLAREVNELLHMAARIENRERSEIVSELLRQYLPKYRVEREG